MQNASSQAIHRKASPQTRHPIAAHLFYPIRFWLTLFRRALYIVRERRRQTALAWRIIHERERQFDGQFLPATARKIAVSHGIYNPMICDAFARLHGRHTTLAEQERLVDYFTCSSLFDDFTDYPSQTDEELWQMSFSEDAYQPKDFAQRVFQHCHRSLKGYVIDKKGYQQITRELFEAQMDSRSQAAPPGPPAGGEGHPDPKTSGNGTDFHYGGKLPAPASAEPSRAEPPISESYKATSETALPQAQGDKLETTPSGNGVRQEPVTPFPLRGDGGEVDQPAISSAPPLSLGEGSASQMPGVRSKGVPQQPLTPLPRNSSPSGGGREGARAGGEVHTTQQIPSQLDDVAQVHPPCGGDGEGLERITFAKGGLSVLLCAHYMAEARSPQEQQCWYTIGTIIQLTNDLFDVWKDLHEGIRTLPNTMRSPEQFEEYFLGRLAEMKRCIRALPASRRRQQAFSLDMAGIYSFGLIALDQFKRLPRHGSEIRFTDYARQQLIIDMEKPANLLAWFGHVYRHARL